MISIPEELLNEIDKKAKKDHRSRSEFIREAVRLLLEVGKVHSVPGQDLRVQKAIAVQDSLANRDVAENWDGADEIRKWRDSH
jgi:metal-responsive CopG/Arc/MetJ family transcriptional regulator